MKVWFQGLKSELYKIIWPTKTDLIGYTIVVLVTLVTVSIYLFFLGQFFGEIFKRAGIV
ncbi:preprotein translocase subunit SecE [bacterium]|nr:preprotein translocase subunit SecE [bacterium]